MATIHDITASRKATALRYYATYGDLCGTATRVAGGYTFRPDTTQATRVVSLSDPALVLLGRCDLADASRAAGEAAGRAFRPHLRHGHRAPLRRPNASSPPYRQENDHVQFSLTPHADPA